MNSRLFFCTMICASVLAADTVGEVKETRKGKVAAPLPANRVADWLEQSLDRLADEVRRAGGNLAKGVSTDVWPRGIESLSPQMANRLGKAWDRDGDGVVNADECRWWLEVAYGFRRPDGTSLQAESGAMVNHIYLLGLDKDSDGAISRAEFIKWYWAGPTENPGVFVQFDLNGDGRLTFEETSVNPMFQLEPVGQLARFDVNADGYVDRRELVAKATKPQMALAERVVRAFDEDHDRRLSVYEFGGTPFSVGVIDLYHPGKDLNDDARLSWSEFYTDDLLFGVELARRYFMLFDLDGDGALSFAEFAFPVRLDRISPEIAFQIQDKNSDGRLLLEEVFTDKKPPAEDAAAMERYEMRLAHAEDHLAADDLDGDGGVDLGEFIQSREAAKRVRVRRSGGEDMPLAYWLRKGVLVANGLIVLIVSWFVFRRQPRNGAARDAGRGDAGAASADATVAARDGDEPTQ